MLQRLRPAFVLVALTGLVALLPASPAAAAKPCIAKLKAPGHKPKADKLWPITVSCKTSSGKGVRATAFYEFIYEGQVVRKAYPSPKADPQSKCSKAGNCRKTPYPFKGSFRDGTFIWPKMAVGYPLTLRVVVTVKGKGSINLDYAVRVHK